MNLHELSEELNQNGSKQSPVLLLLYVLRREPSPPIGSFHINSEVPPDLAQEIRNNFLKLEKNLVDGAGV